ncbi:hypothetical protein PSEUBRA_005253 [Kalmanozyma brasiliensis GHG001]|uniref:uncharacterized protein n=1 Tax=Kalmanozyma brasiliensis (strain GHG001) TaxID=1365824 RepID=UPI0028680888|nr:uncharacterized protein PSEUBRA_005253 [Kalmanozyma brasiliensis GHG001]KAF6767496.1 hypothetical protein PSEUBRA_005253 [Kalmanozyma brasiliensis GHG001]
MTTRNDDGTSVELSCSSGGILPDSLTPAAVRFGSKTNRNVTFTFRCPEDLATSAISRMVALLDRPGFYIDSINNLAAEPPNVPAAKGQATCKQNDKAKQEAAGVVDDGAAVAAPVDDPVPAINIAAQVPVAEAVIDEPASAPVRTNNLEAVADTTNGRATGNDQGVKESDNLAGERSLSKNLVNVAVMRNAPQAADVDVREGSVAFELITRARHPAGIAAGKFGGLPTFQHDCGKGWEQIIERTDREDQPFRVPDGLIHFVKIKDLAASTGEQFNVNFFGRIRSISPLRSPSGYKRWDVILGDSRTEDPNTITVILHPGPGSHHDIGAPCPVLRPGDLIMVLNSIHMRASSWGLGIASVYKESTVFRLPRFDRCSSAHSASHLTSQGGF